MKNFLKLSAIALFLGLTPAATTAGIFSDDATVASRNLSKAADNFEILRRVVFMNGITDNYMMEIIGYCSIKVDVPEEQLEVTCKSPEGWRKHFLGLSDNVTYFVEQMDDAQVSENYYRFTFKPQAIIPDIDFRGGAELPVSQP